jgi:hypothetical protein
VLEACSDHLLPEEAVVDLPYHVLHRHGDHVEPLVVRVPSYMVALGVGQVPITSERCYKLGQLIALGIQWDTVVTLTCISHGLVAALRDAHGLLLGGQDRVCLSKRDGVQLLHVDRPSLRSVLLPDYHHAVLPDRGLVCWDLFQDTQHEVPGQLLLHLFLPVDWDWRGGQRQA